MTYGIWAHFHRGDYGFGHTEGASFFLEEPDPRGYHYKPLGPILDTKETLVKQLRADGECHPSLILTVLARTPDLTDEGCNAICEQCGGPTRRTRDMMTVDEIWATP